LFSELRNHDSAERPYSWVNPDNVHSADLVQSMCKKVRNLSDEIRGVSLEKSRQTREKNERLLYEQFLVGVNNVS